MTDRFLRMLVMFDLPVENAAGQREYRRFRKALIKNGFTMLQESVYTKLLLNKTTETSTLFAIEKEKPHNGIVQILTITETQFNRMKLLVGTYQTDLLQSTDRLVIL